MIAIIAPIQYIFKILKLAYFYIDCYSTTMIHTHHHK